MVAVDMGVARADNNLTRLQGALLGQHHGQHPGEDERRNYDRTNLTRGMVAAGMLMAFGVVLWGVQSKRRALAERLDIEAAANARLEARVAERTRALGREIEARRQTEAELRAALAQAEAEKMAEEVGAEYGRAMAAGLTGDALKAGQRSLGSAIQAVADALVGWPGAIILVSHDEDFVRELAPTKVLLMPDGDVDYFSDDWLDLVSMS